MHQRLIFGMLVYGGIIALIVVRILYLAAFGDHAGRKAGVTALVPERGDIVDREGHPLARTIDAWTISIHPSKVIGDKLELARALARLMPERTRRPISRCCGQTSASIPAPPRAARTGRGGQRTGRAGPRHRSRARPSLPADQPCRPCHRLSPTSTVTACRHGAGLRRSLSDAANRGEPLTLSISSRVQQALENELLDAMTEFSAIGAAGIVMDIHTGEVLAMTSLRSSTPMPPARAARSALQPGDDRRL